MNLIEVNTNKNTREFYMLSLWSCGQIVIQQEGEVCHPIVVLAEKVIFISGCKRVFASMIFEAPSNGGCY
ncbi:hypothetical protein HanXRQr2_Chr16g0748671 [Helianthus annuus]|uniref:Uncharacterized protein n=2 Tax=Helianthus annuus TaxID=4232 RepID=A0A9K3DR39_HELAN|nr:hypothetical protein HanXRQr2_Chr16g0748671 [Helianthus annuus]